MVHPHLVVYRFCHVVVRGPSDEVALPALTVPAISIADGPENTTHVDMFIERSFVQDRGWKASSGR